MTNRILLTIIIILLVGSGVYYFTNKDGVTGVKQEFKNTEDTVEDSVKVAPELTLKESKEESPSEIFKYQPGEIKSIKFVDNNVWQVSVDLLTSNPEWIPGVNDFFINQNTKIRDLLLTEETKTFECGEGIDANPTTPDVRVLLGEYIKKLEDDNYKIRYFDIEGTTITAIYNQCLP